MRMTMFASLLAGAIGDVNVLPLKLFDPSTGAMCLDGSTGGYHARQGSKTQLMISLPGGGWCWNTPTCTERSNTPLGSMDAYIKDRGMTRTVGEGELNGLPSLNPHFFNFSMLSPVYCDGSNFAGARDHDNVTKPGGGTMAWSMWRSRSGGSRTRWKRSC